jgi:predicted DsbA family dithiol-disulfide isomerase
VTKAHPSITLDVVSDVVCPWCFIGKRRMEKALEAFPGAAGVQVRWRPFQLNPGLPQEGVERRPLHLAKFGGEANLKAAYARVAAVGEEEGIPFAQDKIQKQPNTANAHRLLGWAYPSGKQSDLAESLFRAFFCEGLDIGDRRVLAERAGRMGMDAGRALSFLNGGEGIEELKDEEAAYRRMGIRAVPTFILNNRLMLTGAEAPEVILGALEEAAKAETTPGPRPSPG